MSAQAIPTFRPILDESELRLTDEARGQLSTLFGQVDDDEIEAVRIYVTGGGCGGMSYGMTFTDRRTPYDKVLESNGFKVYVDAIALGYLRGVEIDYVDRPTGASFVFNNVFAATGGSGVCSACGAAGGGCA
jgi:iron-sulfur cluster insertion protein